MTKEEFMDEYLNRLAFALAQFWPYSETLPDDEAREDEVYYRVAIRRLSFTNRAELVKRMRQLCSTSAHFFSDSTTKSQRVLTINGVLARFPQLQDAEHDSVTLSGRI
jgi:hypothetical protein